MEKMQREIDNFFNNYAVRINKALKDDVPDIEGTVTAFSHCFIAASPAGISLGKNDEKFKSAIPKGYVFYKKIGITSMNILSNEITPLDSLHAMAKVRWKSNFIKKDKSEGVIEFENIYFMQAKQDVYKIFAYITGDEETALKENGLI